MDATVWIPAFAWLVGAFVIGVIALRRGVHRAVVLRGNGYELRVDASRGHLSLRPDQPSEGRMMMTSGGAEGLEVLLETMPRVSAGSDLDGLYRLWAEPISFAERVLTAETVSRLRALGRRGSLRLHVAPSVINLTVSGSPTDAAERRQWADDLIAAAVAVFGSTRSSVAPSRDDEGRCLVCGTPLRSAIVACAKCATPHHKECWTFIGMCAVYGCGESTVEK